MFLCQLNNTQIDFCKNKICTDAIFTIRQIAEKATENNQELHRAIVHHEKSFTRIDRQKFSQTLLKYWVPARLITVCRYVYINSQLMNTL